MISKDSAECARSRLFQKSPKCLNTNQRVFDLDEPNSIQDFSAVGVLVVAMMGGRFSKAQKASHPTAEAEGTFQVLYKMNSEEAVLRLYNTRSIVGYDDTTIYHLLGRMDFEGNLGVKLLGELRRLEVETVITIRILSKRRVADRSEIYDHVKRMEDTCHAVRDLLDNLMAYAAYPAARAPYQGKASEVWEEIQERKRDLLRLRISLFPRRVEANATSVLMMDCMQHLLTAIIGRGYQDSVEQSLRATGAPSESHPVSLGRKHFDRIILPRPLWRSSERTPLLQGNVVHNGQSYAMITGGIACFNAQSLSL